MDDAWVRPTQVYLANSGCKRRDVEEVMFELCERIRDYCEYKSIKINENLNGISLLEWYGENIFGEYVEKPFKWEAYKIVIRVENGEILEETEFLDDLNLY